MGSTIGAIGGDLAARECYRSSFLARRKSATAARAAFRACFEGANTRGPTKVKCVFSVLIRSPSRLGLRVSARPILSKLGGSVYHSSRSVPRGPGRMGPGATIPGGHLPSLLAVCDAGTLCDRPGKIPLTIAHVRRSTLRRSLLVCRPQRRVPAALPIARDLDLPRLTTHRTVLHEGLPASSTLIDVQLHGLAAVGTAQWKRFRHLILCIGLAPNV